MTSCALLQERRRPSRPLTNSTFRSSRVNSRRDITNGTGGGATYTCGGLNSIGSVPSDDLKPERGVDEEASWGHTWSGDSITQLQLYNVNVYDKLYSSLIPLTQAGTAGINPSYISAANQALSQPGVCGAGNYTLGVSGTVNIGTLQARGFDLSGRQRLSRRFFVDYDWSLTSSVLKNAPPQYLASNLTSIVGSQIKGVPLHSANIAFDGTFGAIDARYTFYTVSINNSKNLPAYDYSDLQFTAPVSRNATFTVAISNLFNQYANIARTDRGRRSRAAQRLRDRLGVRSRTSAKPRPNSSAYPTGKSISACSSVAERPRG